MPANVNARGREKSVEILTTFAVAVSRGLVTPPFGSNVDGSFVDCTASSRPSTSTFRQTGSRLDGRMSRRGVRPEVRTRGHLRRDGNEAEIHPIRRVGWRMLLQETNPGRHRFPPPRHALAPPQSLPFLFFFFFFLANTQRCPTPFSDGFSDQEHGIVSWRTPRVASRQMGERLPQQYSLDVYRTALGEGQETGSSTGREERESRMGRYQRAEQPGSIPL